MKKPDCINKKTTGIFTAGLLFGTAGLKVLTSHEAKKVYTSCTAAVLRAKDCVMNVAAKAQDNAEDIYAGAQQINADRDEVIYTELAEKEAAKAAKEAEIAEAARIAEAAADEE